MNVNRRLLYWGVFFLVTGAVVLVAQGTDISSADVAAALALWPVAIIALGAGLLLRRTRFNLAGGMMAAAMPGLLLGGLIVAAPDMPGDCRVGQPVPLETQRGTFGATGVVNLRLACGEMTVTTAPGYGWQTETGNGRGFMPVVTATDGRLSIASAARSHVFGLGPGGDVWRVTLPASSRLDLAADISAGRGTFDLAGAQLGSLDLVVNAGDARVDLGGATVDRLSLNVNAGAVSLVLPSAPDASADVRVNAGSVKVCAPQGVGLRITEERQALATIHHTGLVRVGDAWESPDYAAAAHHADVSVTANVGSVDINPEGGCR